MNLLRKGTFATYCLFKEIALLEQTQNYVHSIGEHLSKHRKHVLHPLETWDNIHTYSTTVIQINQ